MCGVRVTLTNIVFLYEKPKPGIKKTRKQVFMYLTGGEWGVRGTPLEHPTNQDLRGPRIFAPAPPNVSCVPAERELVSVGPLPLYLSGGGQAPGHPIPRRQTAAPWVELWMLQTPSNVRQLPISGLGAQDDAFQRTVCKVNVRELGEKVRKRTKRTMG